MVHEAGHFAMAKKVGVRVLRFSIGYPPKIWGVRRGETDYSIGATPFGGYVRMLGDEVGEEPKSEELASYLHEIGLDLIGAARDIGLVEPTNRFEDDLRLVAERLHSVGHTSGIGRPTNPCETLLLNEVSILGGNVNEAIKALSANPKAALLESFEKRSFPSQTLGKRTLIVLAGPAANIFFAPLLLTLVFMFGVPSLLPVVGELKKGMPADVAGLRTGDVIRSINGKHMESWNEFSQTIKSGDGSPLKFEIERKEGAASKLTEIVVRPTKQEQKTVYGTTAVTWIIGVMPRGDEVVKHYGPFGAVKEAVKATVDMTGQLAVGIGSIFTGATPMREALGGPIMIAKMAGQQAHAGFANIAMFTVMLSLELGIINLLPVPLLDGGHLLFFAFEGVRGKPLEIRYREMMLQVGLFLLVALMAFVIFNDISRIVQG